MKMLTLFGVFIAATLWSHASPVPLPSNCAATGLAAAGQLPPSGHAHNDYLHGHPLTDALAAGFGSVEADVWPIGGDLYVAHTRDRIEPDRTLRSLYLEPLARLYEEHDPAIDGLQLVIDVKTDPAAALPVLQDQLQAYAPMLTSYTGCEVHHRPVSVVVSGTAPPEAPTTSRMYFGYDVRPEGLQHGAPGSVVAPLVSARWRAYLSWDGDGPIPAAQRTRLQDLVDTVHSVGSRLRFWGVPDDPGPARTAIWTALADAGVDFINTDDLAGFADFLHARTTTATT